MIELVLKKPIIAHKETLHVLEIREPTYDEIEALGFPFSVSPDGGMKMDSQVALKYIPLLAGIPRSSAAQMTKLGYFQGRHDCNAFFLPAWRRKRAPEAILQCRVVLEIKPP
ncbi:phage protein [Escherichia coli]|nr:phage tail assembly protein [Escherichia coli]STG44804.1 phage protein [Escherichia coli]